MFTRLKEFSEKVNSFKDAIQNESQTRSVLIEPVIKLLGFDTANPFDVVAEYTCDVGTKKGEKVDYALMHDNEIVVLIEAKDCKVKLNEKNIGQLFRYYSVSSARVALLTNGLDYLFFTDTVKQNVMDSEPFFRFNILDFTEKEAQIMELFQKENINSEKIREYAITSAFSKQFTDYFINQSLAPTNDFVTFIIKNIGVSNLNSTDATKLVSKELSKMLINPVDSCLLNDLEDVPLELTSIKSKAKPKKRVNTENKNKLTGLIELSELDAKNSPGTKPTALIIENQNYEVLTWSDVLIATIKHCKHLGKNTDFILELDGQSDNSKGWVRSNSKDMRTPREFEQGIFVDVHASGIDNIKRVRSILAQLNIEQSEVMLELK